MKSAAGAEHWLIDLSQGAAAAMGGSKLLQQGTCGGGGVEQLGEQVDHWRRRSVVT